MISFTLSCMWGFISNVRRFYKGREWCAVKFFQEKKLRMICIRPLSLEGPAVSLPFSKNIPLKKNVPCVYIRFIRKLLSFPRFFPTFIHYLSPQKFVFTSNLRSNCWWWNLTLFLFFLLPIFFTEWVVL